MALGQAGSPWSGVGWTLAAAALWVGLALVNPGTTYHLAPVVTVLAWPVVGRSRVRPSRWTPGLWRAAGGAATAAAATLALQARHAMSGPALIGDRALEETAILGIASAVVAVLLARPHHAPARDGERSRI